MFLQALSKGGFFSESAIRLSDLQISKKFKFQAQDSFLEYFYFGDLEI